MVLCPWHFPGSPSQGVFLIQGSNLGLSHCREILYCLSHLGSPSWGREMEMGGEGRMGKEQVTWCCFSLLPVGLWRLPVTRGVPARPRGWPWAGHMGNCAWEQSI